MLPLHHWSMLRFTALEYLWHCSWMQLREPYDGLPGSRWCAREDVNSPLICYSRNPPEFLDSSRNPRNLARISGGMESIGWVIHLMVEDWSGGADEVSLWHGRWHTRRVLRARHDRPHVYQATHFIPHLPLLCCLGREELKPFCC